MYLQQSLCFILTLTLLIFTQLRTGSASQQGSDETKPVLSDKQSTPADESSCTLNGRSPIVCSMCADILHQLADKQDGAGNMADGCCESAEIYETCEKALKMMVDSEEDNWSPEMEAWSDSGSSSNENEDDAIDDVTDVLDSEDKRAMNPFLGKRGNPFLGKLGNPFLGKREHPFLGKRSEDEMDDKRGGRSLNPFLGKRKMNPFLGKRKMNPFLGKRAMNPFLGKRKMNPFLGKRAMNPFLGKRAMNPFLGKRAMNPFLGKRPAMNPFLG